MGVSWKASVPMTLVPHLAGDGQQGDAVQLGVGDRGHQVRGPGAAGGHADADLAGAPGVALGGKSAALLVPRQDDAELVAEARQRLVQRDARPARIGENRVHPVVHQRLDDDVRPAGRFRRRRGHLFRVGRVFWLILHGKHLLPSPNPQEGATRSGKHFKIRPTLGKFKRRSGHGSRRLPCRPPRCILTAMSHPVSRELPLPNPRGNA